MIARKTRSHPVALLLALSTLMGAASAQAPEKPDPVFKERMSELQDAFKDRKGEKDQQAIETIDTTLPEYDNLHPKDQALFIKTLGKAFSAKREPEEIVVFVAASAALGKIGGKDASKILLKAYDGKTFSKRKEWGTLQDTLLEHLGMCKDPKQVKFLLDEASRSPHDGVKAAAGRALRHYEEQPFKVRVEIVKQLIQAFANVANQAARIGSNDPQTETARRTLRAISEPWNETLGLLTGESLRTAPEWRSWWNDHKNKPKSWKHQTDD